MNRILIVILMSAFLLSISASLFSESQGKIGYIDLSRSFDEYQKTKDFQNDQDLIRRPERKFFAECFWQATRKLGIDLKLR